MQMWPRRVTRLTDKANHVARIYRLSLAQIRRESRKMRVARHIAARMADIDDVAVAIAPAGKFHLALSNGNHRRSGRSRVVDRQVRSDSTKDRIESSGAERRRNARVTQGCTQER